MLQLSLEVKEEERDRIREGLERWLAFQGQMDDFKLRLMEDLDRRCRTVQDLEAFHALTVRRTYRARMVPRWELVETIVRETMTIVKERALDRYLPRPPSHWREEERELRRRLEDDCADYEDLLSEYIRVWRWARRFAGFDGVRYRESLKGHVVHEWVEYQRFRRGFLTHRDERRLSRARRMEREHRRRERDADDRAQG